MKCSLLHLQTAVQRALQGCALYGLAARLSGRVNGVPEERSLLISATHAFQDAVSSVKGNQVS